MRLLLVVCLACCLACPPLQVCAFQRKFPDFKAAGAEVFGISSGGKDDKEKFVSKNKVSSYELLMDHGDVVRKQWKVPRALMGKYTTYIYAHDSMHYCD